MSHRKKSTTLSLNPHQLPFRCGSIALKTIQNTTESVSDPARMKINQDNASGFRTAEKEFAFLEL